MTFRSQRFLSVFIALLLSMNIQQALAITDAEAVNISGSQRMLTQRMMKDYLMLGAGVKADKAQTELSASVERFESNLDVLTSYSDLPIINSQLEKVKAMWAEHKTGLLSLPDKEAAVALMKENLELLGACHQLVLNIEGQSAQRNADIVNISGRQRMLSQRIAKAYMALYWGVPSTELESEFKNAQNQFADALAKLKAFDGNSTDIGIELDRVSVHWKFAQPGFELGEGKHPVPGNIFTTMNSIMDKMNDITKQYELLLNK
ncbi:MAG: type IV pili methyl-accepting chemotaxis transducer N-terminal domain-containing protein [Oceanobacter sp.]